MNRYADRRANAVAVISPDPLVAALLGAAVELYGYRVEFPREGESYSETLRRVRPSHVLIDANDPGAVDDALLGHSMMRATPVLVFGTRDETEPVRTRVMKYGARVLVFPGDVAALPHALARRAPPTEAPARG